MSRRNHIIYDPGNGTPVQGADANHSLTVNNPAAVFLEGMVTGTDIAVQMKIDVASAWHTTQTILGSAGATALVEFTGFENYVQLVRTGAANPIGYAVY